MRNNSLYMPWRKTSKYVYTKYYSSPPLFIRPPRMLLVTIKITLFLFLKMDYCRQTQKFQVDILKIISELSTEYNISKWLIYRFWLHLWYLRFTDSDYTFGILDLQILITSLVSSSSSYFYVLWCILLFYFFRLEVQRSSYWKEKWIY